MQALAAVEGLRSDQTYDTRGGGLVWRQIWNDTPKSRLTWRFQNVF